MTDKPATMVNQELLFWSGTVVIELVILTALTGWILFLLAIIPMVYWPIRDALNWPVPKDPPPPPAETPAPSQAPGAP